MSDANEVFNILQNEGTLDGEAATSRRDKLDLVAAIRGLIGFAFQTHDGYAVLPTLTTDGKLPVTSDSAGIHSEDQASVEGVIGVPTLVCTATLTADKLYKLEFLSGASTQTVVWDVVPHDDGVDGPSMHKFITGAGQYTFSVDPGCLEITAASSGPQELRLYGNQLKGKVTDMHGTICLRQIGA